MVVIKDLISTSGRFAPYFPELEALLLKAFQSLRYPEMGGDQLPELSFPSFHHLEFDCWSLICMGLHQLQIRGIDFLGFLPIN